MGDFINVAANALSKSLTDFSNYSAKAAARANAVSAGAQAAAAKFNQASSDNANNINASTLAGQFANNSAGATMANDFSSSQWAQAASWNEEMFERQMEFNAKQAQLQRDWAERMDNTKYQRAMADMKAGGLNPILAYGGINSSASGSAASVSAPQMGFAHGAQPTQGVLGANDASISGYNGQMEYMAGILGLMSATLSAINSGQQYMQQNTGDTKTFIGLIKDLILDQEKLEYSNGKGQRYRDANNRSLIGGLNNRLNNPFSR